MPNQPLLTLGLLLSLAVAFGYFGDRLRLPRVTSFLIAGVLCGPSCLGFVSHDELHHFIPIADLAMALVLFNLGSHFSIQLLAKIKDHIIPVAIGDLVLTNLCVTAGLYLLGLELGPAMMLGCLAMATAPATTVLVLKELKSEGPVTESAQALVAINNLATIVAFELLMVLLLAFNGGESVALLPGAAQFLLTFSASIVLGAVLGFVLSFSAGFMNTMQWIAVLIATSMVSLGLCETFPLFYMLVFLVAGFVFANTAQNNEQDLLESGKLTSLLCVAFFVIHGAELRLDQFLKLGTIGAAYVALRIAGKYFGTRLAAGWSHESLEMRNWLGATMLSQAGAAIALSAAAVTRNPAFEPVQTIILGSVIVFEIIGPLLIRTAVVRSGEVPIAHVARHSDHSVVDQFQIMWSKLITSFGADPRPHLAAPEMTVASLARSRFMGIPQNAQFDEIIAHIEHSHDNTFPVVNSKNQVVGIIRYPMLSETLFDPTVTKLVRAEDIATPVERVTYSDESAASIVDFFMSSSDDCIPIVSRDSSQHMEGIVRRADLRTMLIRKRKKGGGGH